MGYFVHASSCIDDGCEIGDETRIWHFSHIMRGCKIGKHCNIGQNVVVSPNVVLGDGVKTVSYTHLTLPTKLEV